jgi:hypothetical protein
LKFKIFIFFLIGLFIYIIDIGFNSDQNSKDIFISDQEITSLISAWKSQVGRSPTDDEISRIITNLIEEEILYREALLLGLDKEDRIIKRRLAQKISFLKQESLVDKPSNNDLIGIIFSQHSPLSIISFQQKAILEKGLKQPTKRY